ncbi:DUF4156 domain-containing protein [Desulfoferula mesophila]|uniref:DUF4156 domain-containing protein n=1 Tax=Desulfoferula mesophila TaxID=3058419 RepID=A0AAU9EBR5_9BACT|nr:hypothetical protein FAK_16620 [Desulfoferula mesophilus]
MQHKALTIWGLAACLAIVGGCSQGAAQKLVSTEVPAPARLAEAGEVQGCRFVGDVTGYAKSTRSGTASLARLSARDDLRQRAGAMGATDVVVQSYKGNRRAVATGKAYQCP